MVRNKVISINYFRPHGINQLLAIAIFLLIELTPMQMWTYTIFPPLTYYFQPRTPLYWGVKIASGNIWYRGWDIFPGGRFRVRHTEGKGLAWLRIPVSYPTMNQQACLQGILRLEPGKHLNPWQDRRSSDSEVLWGF